MCAMTAAVGGIAHITTRVNCRKMRTPRDGASSMVSKYSKVTAGEGETEKHRCDDGTPMYHPTARVVLSFTLTIHGFPLCADSMGSNVNDPADDGGNVGSSSDSIKRNVTGGEGKSETTRAMGCTHVYGHAWT